MDVYSFSYLLCFTLCGVLCYRWRQTKCPSIWG